jgi:transcriptional regulator with XRE-family HTH domain
MPPRVTDPRTLFRNVVDVLDHGLRTSTYKLATMTALIDLSVAQGFTSSASELEVPIADLARTVIALYWDQSKPFKGAPLRQSTQSESRIFEAIASVRTAAKCPDDDLTLDRAAGFSPETYRRAIDDVGVCLSQQSLPRLQRVKGAVRGAPFLYDDSFLHDNVTRSELARRRNSIQLFPGVAYGLTLYANELRRAIHTVWVDDVIRMNQMSPDQRQAVDEHLFRKSENQPHLLGKSRRATLTGDSSDPTEQASANSIFASRLNRLFDAAKPAYSSGEVANRIRQLGIPMTVRTLTDLRAGIGPYPSKQTIRTLAKYFGVDSSYFSNSESDVGDTSTVHVLPQSRQNPSADVADTGIFSDDLVEISASCAVLPNGCWSRSSNTPVSCQPPGDMRKPRELPKIELYRWAWLVANGYQGLRIPSSVLRVRHTCDCSTCCNPQHLYVTSSSGSPLSKTAIDGIVRTLPGWSMASAAKHKSRLVLPDNINAIRNHCTIDQSGCWIAPVAGPVACRATGNGQQDDQLPMMAPHRWVWMVENSHSSNPLPAIYQVRRRCRNDMCCRSSHLYLATREGRELTAEEAGRELQRGKGGPPPDAARATGSLFAARLNKVFDAHLGTNGNPYTSEEVAAALQEEGFHVSASLIERLRSGHGDPPSEKTIDALAYFFNVDAEYFSAGAHSAIVSETLGVDAARRPLAASTVQPSPSPDDKIEVSVFELGSTVKALSETISGLLEHGDANNQTVIKLLEILTEVGDVIAAPGDVRLIDRQLLQQLVTVWNSAARPEEHRLVIARLEQCLQNG